ncbi:MAG TPA: hypothetical protein VJ972_04420, partial [Anaerolineales bacterium]|nr:hypothetical protein [Anaerolineales bacterium]
MESFDDYYPELITALNQGTSIQTVIAIFEKKIDEFYFPNTEILVHSKIRYELVDVTNDGVPEILLPGSISDQPNAIILGCHEGEYRMFYSRNYDTAKRIYFMPVDANRNGINEIILVKESGTATGSWIELSVIEWHIDSFHEILTDDYSSSVFQLVMVNDLDNDNTKEIFWRFGAYIYSFPPWRRGTITYKWNGEKFVALPLEYDPVQYRFQATQDGDRAITNGNFSNAQSLYQEAIFNQDLE